MPAEEISNLIGKNTDNTIYRVENGAIRRFAQAVGDSNPIFTDEEYARKTQLGTIIAPPGFFGWPAKQNKDSALMVEFPTELIETLEKNGYSMASALDAGIEYDFYLPVHGGDILTSTSTVKDIRERVSKTGKIVIFVMETTYVNQTGHLAASSRATYVLRAITG